MNDNPYLSHDLNILIEVYLFVIFYVSILVELTTIPILLVQN